MTDSSTLSIAASALLTAGVTIYTFAPSRETALYALKTRQDFLEERRDNLYDNLRDLNFEYKAGKFADEDYLRERDTLESEAATVLAELDDLHAQRGL